METILREPRIQEEIAKLSKISNNTITSKDLEQLVLLAIQAENRKLVKTESLPIEYLKQAIYNYFEVNNTDELRKSEQFKMATDGMDKLDFRQKTTWEMLYRKWINILPSELNQEGHGCINGINIFKYFRPWQVFNLDRETADAEAVKKAFRQLSKQYHPDNPETGDREIFERLEKMYKSILAGVS